MGLTVLVIGLALLLAVVSPSRPGHRPQLRATGALVAACLVLLAEPLLSVHVGLAYPALLGVGALLLARFAFVNRAVPGIVLACFGVCLNASVVLANGSMPVETHAVLRAGIDPAALALDSDPRHELADGSTALRWLDDRIAVPTPRVAEVISLGDVAIAAGVGLFVFGFTRRHRREMDPYYVMMSEWAPPRSPERC